MKKNTSVCKRLLAMLMVFAMVIGYVPVSTVAAEAVIGTVTYNESALPKVTVLRKSVTEEIPTEATETTEGSEETTESTAAPEVKTTYTYSLNVVYGAAIIAAEDLDSVVWTAGDQTLAENVAEVSCESAEVSAKISYQGLEITVTSTADGKTTGTWAGVTAGTLNTVYKGVYFTMPESTVTDAAAVTRTYAGADVNDGKYYTNADSLTVTESIYVNGIKVADVTYEATTEATPVPTVTLTANPAANENGWNNSDVVVTASAQDVGYVSADYLPAVETESVATSTGWTLANGTWTNSVTVTGNNKVTCNGQSLEVKIDKIPPVIDEDSYAAHDQWGNTYVKIDATDAESGIAKVLINGKERELLATGYYKIEGGADSITIEVIDAAGNSTTFTNGVIQSALDIEFVEPTIAEGEGGTIGKVTYVKAGTTIEIRVKNINDNEYALDQAASTVAGEAVNWTKSDDGSYMYYLYTIPATMADLEVYAKDAMGRDVTESLGKAYAIGDTNAPVITVGDVVNGNKGAKTITVTVSDADGNLSPETEEGTLSISYDIVKEWYDKQQKKNVSTTETKTYAVSKDNLNNWTVVDGAYTFEISYQGEKGKNVYVNNISVTAKDNTNTANSASGTNTPSVSDNYAPVITAEFVEGTVTALRNLNGSWFAVVDPTSYVDGDVYDPDAAVSVTLRITATDASVLTADCFTGGTWVQADDEGHEWYLDVPVTVKDFQTAKMDINFTVHDIHNNWSTDSFVIEPNAERAPNEVPESITVTYDDGYKATLNFDRRAPGSVEVVSDAPTITLDDGYTDEERPAIYNKPFDFTVSIDDNVYTEITETDEDGNETKTIIAGGYNAGVESIDWTLTDGLGNEFATSTGRWTAEGTYTIPVSPAAADGLESDQVKLNIVVTDKLGNVYTYNKTFAFDNKLPRVTVTYTDNEPEGTLADKYFQNARELTVSVEDLNYNGMTVTVDGTPVQLTAEQIDYTTTYTTEGEHTLAVAVTDNAGNVAVIDYTNGNTNVEPEHFYIDSTTPEITVTPSIASIASDDVASYFDAEVTYTVTVKDLFLDNAVATVYFETGDPVDVVLTQINGENETDADVATGTFTATNGMVITDIVVNAADKSGRTSAWKNSENGTGKYIVVDTTAPTVEVVKSFDDEETGCVQTYNGVDYYNGTVTYTITVKDNFLDKGVGAVALTNTGSAVAVTFEKQESDVQGLAALDVYQATITVADGQMLEDFSFQVYDNAKNSDETKLTVNDLNNTNDNQLTKFDYSDATWNYAGNKVVVDTVAPTATLKFSENVKELYTNGNKLYVMLETPVIGNSGETKVGDQNVSVTFTITDKNLAYVENDSETIAVKTANGEWVGLAEVNTESTLTYTAEAKVSADGTAMFPIDLTLIDLAGHTVEKVTQEVVLENGEIWLPVVDEKNGVIDYDVYVDRRRPTSSDSDVDVPVLTLIPTVDPVATVDGKELFNSVFNFHLSVNDGTANSLNSGLKNVQWKITDSQGVVVGTDEFVPHTFTEQTFSEDYDIEIKVGGEGRKETNSVELIVSAEDNVGNIVTITKQFCVDVEAPKITFSVVEEKHTREGKFYNGDRVIKLEVEDLNFDSGNTTITTQDAAEISGWTNDGIVWTKTIAYRVDGDYSLEASSTDLAGHTTKKGDDNYSDAAVENIADFTIDKTAPKIHVNFNPFVPVDTDPQGIQYFDDVRNLSVTIEEHNFKAEDVQADLGAANALGAWSHNGDNHTASEMFTEGNGYKVTINYTDLAGNPAETYTSPTFSVDLGAPEIIMNKGDLKTGGLNIIPDDLILGFEITDHEDNLKEFHVEVLFLNNDYQQTRVEGVEYYTVTDHDGTTGYIDFTNIASDKANDGIYTVRVTAVDYAGHYVTYPDVVFSLNRFGSTFVVYDDYTKEFLTTDETGVVYQNEVINELVVTEINPNKVWQDSTHTVEGSIITIAANGTSITLVPGEDYTVTVTENGNGGSKWYEYTYHIDPSVFLNNDELVDGEYTIFFYSEDEAGNKNTNETNLGSTLMQDIDGEYSGKITFVLDHQDPVVTILNIEEGGQYVEENREVEINISDNSPVSIAVYINDLLVEFVEVADGQPINSDWLTYDPISGNYILNMSAKDEPQNVRVVVTDAAGNVFEQTVGDITLTENLWVQFINNELLVIGSVVGLIGLIILIILLLKRKKKEEEPEAV